MATVTIRLPEELRQGLADAARHRGTTCSRLLRDAAMEIVGRRSRGRRSLYDLTRDICGIVDDAPRDLSTSPRHLRGFGR